MIGMDLLGIEDLERADIERILHTAEHMREIGNREVKKVPTLRGRTVVNLFFESSTRTRSSFEIAAKRLSADVVNFSPSSSSLKKSESILERRATSTPWTRTRWSCATRWRACPSASPTCSTFR